VKNVEYQMQGLTTVVSCGWHLYWMN